MVVDSVGIVSAFLLVDLGQDPERRGQRLILCNKAGQPEGRMQTYSLSLNRVYSSSPTLTGEPPN